MLKSASQNSNIAHRRPQLMMRSLHPMTTSPPQSNLRKVRRSTADKTSSKLLGPHSPSMLSPFKTSLAEWDSAQLATGIYVSVCRCTLTTAKWLLGHSYSRTGVSPCCACFVLVSLRFCRWLSLQPPIRSWTWLYIVRKGIRQRIQRCNLHREILSTFYTRVDNRSIRHFCIVFTPNQSINQSINHFIRQNSHT